MACFSVKLFPNLLFINRIINSGNYLPNDGCKWVELYFLMDKIEPVVR